MDYSELVKDLRVHRCDAKEDDTQDVCEECAYDVIIADKSTFSGIKDVCTCGLMHRAADAIEQLQKDLERSKEYEAFWEKEANEALRKFQVAIASKPRWIPVTERLPKDNEAVNVVWVNHNPVFYYQHIKDKPQTSTGVYYRGQWYWWSAVTQDYLAEYGTWEPDLMDTAVEVTHWMPLPEPPKEETE